MQVKFNNPTYILKGKHPFPNSCPAVLKQLRPSPGNENLNLFVQIKILNLFLYSSK